MATKKEPLPSFAEAVDALQRGMNAYRAFADAHKALTLLQNLDQVTSEREAQAAGALKMKDDAQAELGKALDDLAAAKAEAKSIRDKAKEKASALLLDAEQKGGAMILEAQERAAAVKAESDKMVADMLAAKGDLDAKLAEIADADAKIARAKAKMAEILGG